MGELNKRNIIPSNFGGGGNFQLTEGKRSVCQAILKLLCCCCTNGLCRFTKFFTPFLVKYSRLFNNNQSPLLSTLISDGVIFYRKVVSGSKLILKHRFQSAVQHDENNNAIPKAFIVSKVAEKSASCSTVHLKKCAAFTLAEVLITLGIIGVVAAMTMPSLMQKYHEQKRVTQLKRTMSVLQNAFLMAKNEYGEIQDWGLSITNTGEQDEEGNPVYDYSGGENVMKILMKYVHSAKVPQGDTDLYIESLDGRQAFWPYTISSDRVFYLNDGTIVQIGWISSLDCTTTIYGIKNRCADFWIFFPKKSTMRLGVDVFNVFLTKDGFKPIYYLPYCSKDKAVGSADTNGRGCSGWVMAHGNMDYLRRDVSADD